MSDLLSKMTLLQLASAVALADSGPDHDKYTREIIRRQRQLDAAEAMAKVLESKYRYASGAARAALDAYQAAKEDR
jgi:hypothetical protein